MNRFIRTERLIGSLGLTRLTGARVLVAGLGAVGSYAVEGLARAGVGHLCLVDFDEVRKTNINRQLYALDSTLHQKKTDLAAARVRDINPLCQVETRAMLINRASVESLFDRPFDAVVDAIDSLAPKLSLLHAAAQKRGLFVVSSMGAATRTDPLLIRSGTLEETEMCPLARAVRKRLRRLGPVDGIRCIYSIEPVPPARAEPEEPEDAALAPGRIRSPLGSLSTLTGIFGLMAATEVLRHLAGDAWPRYAGP